MVDLLSWLRRHNETRPRAEQVSLSGFDVQLPQLALLRVLDLLGGHSAGARGAAERNYAAFQSFLPAQSVLDRGGEEAYAAQMDSFVKFRTASRRRRRETTLGVAAVLADLENRADEYRSNLSAPAVSEAQHAARVVVWAESLYRSAASATPGGLAGAFNLIAAQFARTVSRNPAVNRERAMADCFTWLHAQAAHGAKTVLWTHNLHTLRRPGSMGSLLRDTYGDEVLTVVGAFAGGVVRARRLASNWTHYSPIETFDVPTPQPGSYEAGLSEVGREPFWLDLRKCPETSPWLDGPRTILQIGASYSPNHRRATERRLRLREQADVVTFVGRSTPTHSLDGPARA
jgi:erythromycin esterase-like protein